MFNSQDIQEIEEIIGCPLPTSILNELSDPESPFWGKPDALRFVFMSASEHLLTSSLVELSQIPELKIFLADAESNLVGIFVSGPMSGRIALVGHDTNIDCAPLYRCLSSFVYAVKAGFKTLDAEWPYQVDYPNRGDELQTVAQQADIEGDNLCVEQIKAQVATEQNPIRIRFLNSCIVSLTPKERASQLMPTLENSDYHVCGRASIMLGFHQIEESCERLAQIALDTANPARFAAVDGLGIMNTKTSRDALMKLIRDGGQLPGNITTALKQSGFEIMFERFQKAGIQTIEWYVRFSGDGKLELINVDCKTRPSFWWKFEH